MSGSSFDAIAQEIINQKLIMEQMEDENRELHRQLADLRDGRGIFVDIGGARFALVELAANSSFSSFADAQMTEMAKEGSTEVEVEQEPGIEVEVEEEAALYDFAAAEAPTDEIVERPTQPGRETALPVPAESFLVEDETSMPSFLEELMIDEFTTATATSTVTAIRMPKAVWSATEVPPQRPQLSDEETKAALRRELIGSFLLE